MLARPEVWVVDDDAAVTRSLCALLNAEGYEGRGFDSPRAFLDFVHSGCQGCLVSDVNMPGMSGLEMYQAMQEMGVVLPVIFITGYADVSMAIQALRAGAADFIEKPFTNDMLLDSLKRVVGLERLSLDRGRLAGLRARHAQLTQREKDVMSLVAEGLSSKDIARKLGISPRTVDIHRSHVMDKMKASSLAELVRQALLLGSPAD